MNKTQKSARYFYKQGITIQFIEENGDELKQECLYKKQKRQYRYYEAGKGYEANLSSLIQYREDFIKWTDETKNDINYSKYYKMEYIIVPTNKIELMNINNLSIV